MTPQGITLTVIFFCKFDRLTIDHLYTTVICISIDEIMLCNLLCHYVNNLDARVCVTEVTACIFTLIN